MKKNIALLFILLPFFLFQSCSSGGFESAESFLIGTFRISQVKTESFVNGKSVVSLAFADKGTISLRADGKGTAVVDGSSSDFTWTYSGSRIVISHPVADMVFQIEKEAGSEQLVLLKNFQHTRDGIQYEDMTRWTLSRL